MNQEAKHYEPWLVEAIEKAKERGYDLPLPERYLLSMWAQHNGWRENSMTLTDFLNQERRQAWQEFKKNHLELFKMPEVKESKVKVPILPTIIEFCEERGHRRSGLSLEEFIFVRDLWPKIRKEIMAIKNYDAGDLKDWDFKMASIYRTLRRALG